MNKTLLKNLIAIVAYSTGTQVSAATWNLVDVIVLGEGQTNVKHITNDGAHLFVLHQGSPFDEVRMFDLGGTLVRAFPMESQYTSGITWDGNNIVVGSARGFEDVDYYRFAFLDPTTGSISGPRGPILGNVKSMAFDGTDYLVTSFPGEGIWHYDASTLANTDRQMLNPSPYGIEWDATNQELFAHGFTARQVYRYDQQLNLIEQINTSQNTWAVDITVLDGDIFLLEGQGIHRVFRYTQVIPEPTASATAAIAAFCVLGHRARTRRKAAGRSPNV